MVETTITNYQIDTKIAEFMGWRNYATFFLDENEIPRSPSTSDADAMLVVRKMIERGWLVTLWFHHCGWTCRFYERDVSQHEATRPELSHAICEAALLTPARSEP